MISKKTVKEESVIAITVGLLFLYVTTHSRIFLYGSLTIGLLGIISSYFAEKIHFFWMKLATVLGLIVPTFLLIIIFYFVLTPLSFLAKWTSKEPPLVLKNSNSTFTSISTRFDATFFEKTW